MLGVGNLTKKLFGSANDRLLKSVQPFVVEINGLESQYEKLSESEIIQKTQEFKTRAGKGESLDDLLPETFALTREVGKRALGLRIFDVQMVGGIFLHKGNISEMKTGEGKTLVATLPAYLNSLTGENVHIVTVNDYLARRDSEWMGKVYSMLGMTVDVITPDLDKNGKRKAYSADITYGTNNEFGFDYLRDNMVPTLETMVQRGHHFAIIDEVDSILIDEARTPLVISGPAGDRSELYNSIQNVIPLVEPEDYELDEKTRNVTLTDEGNDHLEILLKERELLPENQSLYDAESVTIVHHVTQGLRANKAYFKDKDYIVRNGQVVLIDEFTGRMMTGRRLSEGLHQAIEAKERVPIQSENVTLASVTFQNYFRLYSKLSGMTGTALTEAEEFGEIYGLGVVEIPTNEPVARIDEDDRVYRTSKEKHHAILKAIKEAHDRKQPILVGTTSIDKSETLSKILTKNRLKHNVLNARHHEQEAKIIAEAGIPGAITIATNMAGRGTDIQLGGNVEMKVLEKLEENTEQDPAEIRAKIEQEVAEDKQIVIKAGGLFVLATERHESRRIDNQLRGRSGRQGDPGNSSFFLSLEDDLMRIFGSERLDKVLNTIGMEENEAIVHPWVNKSLEKAQRKVEGRNFDIRKQLLKYDDVMNDQRKAIFSQRMEVLESEDVSDIIEEMRLEVVDTFVDQYIPPKSYPDQWEMKELREAVHKNTGVDLPMESWAEEDGVDEETVRERIYDASTEYYEKRKAEFSPEIMGIMQKQILLQSMDHHWREHLVALEHLRSVIGFRGYAQKDPLNEFKREGFGLFQSLLSNINNSVTRLVSFTRPVISEPGKPRETTTGNGKTPVANSARQQSGSGMDSKKPSNTPYQKPGRNKPCHCGSGKKFKHCCGRPGQQL